MSARFISILQQLRHPDGGALVAIAKVSDAGRPARRDMGYVVNTFTLRANGVVSRCLGCLGVIMAKRLDRTGPTGPERLPLRWALIILTSTLAGAAVGVAGNAALAIGTVAAVILALDQILP